MREKYFLFKENGIDDRDCVKYIEFEESDNLIYFNVCGACFSGMTTIDKENALSNYCKLTTLLSKDELKKLFDILNVWTNERTQDENEFVNEIRVKLAGYSNQILFERVQKEEKEFLWEAYGINEKEADDVFDYLDNGYRDRAIVSCVYNNTKELGVNYVDNFCSIDRQLRYYINYEQLGDDLVEDGNYFELEDGRIVELTL